MMSRQLTRHQIRVVRENHHRCQGFVVAASGDCFDVQRQETWGTKTRVPGRGFKPIVPDALEGLQLPDSWFMGVLLCPGDVVRAIVTWFGQLPPSDRSRVKFYLHPEFDRGAAADAFDDVAIPSGRVVKFEGAWENFHPLFGLDHAMQVVADFDVDGAE